MTKKILALALAGTTAFSVFASAMSVNAAPVYALPTTTELTFAATPSVAPGAAITATTNTGVAGVAKDAVVTNYETALTYTGDTTVANFVADLANYTPIYAIAKALSFDGISAEVESGKIYIYDYATVSSSKVNDFEDATNDFIAAFEKANAALKNSTTWADGITGTSAEKTLIDNVEAAEDALFTAMGAAMPAGTVLKTAASVGTTRATVFTEFEDFRDNIQPASDYDFDSADDKADYTSLYNEVIKDIYKGKAYESQRSSTLVYLMRFHEKLTENVVAADTYDYEDLIAFYTEILDARNEADYKNAYNYNGFLEDYGALQGDYEDATSASKLKAYAGKLYDLILAPTGTAATSSKDDLKAAIKNADEYYDNRAQYDQTTSEWETFLRIRNEAKDVSAARSAVSYQSTIDAYTEKLNEALGILDPSSSVSDWVWVRLQNAIATAEDLVETDYTASSWKKVTTALTRAQNLVDASSASKNVLNSASQALEDAIGALVVVKPSATVKRQLKDTIAEAKKALENAAGNGAQVLALNKAISDADDLWSTKYTTLKNNTTISNVEDAIAALEAAMTSAAQPQGWYTTEAGAWMYGEGDGYYVDGWKKIGNFWFHFDANGIAKQNEWMSEGGKWYYFGNSCVAYAGWGKVDGSWYYFDKGNAMCTGWIKLGNTWYYLDPTSGKMVTGWATIGGTSYYFSTEASTLGAMLVSTTTPDGYTVDANGA